VNTNENIQGPDDAGDEQIRLRELLDDVGTDFVLPSGGTELILMEIDPHRAHVCWNIDPSQSRPFHPLVLRVYDITGTGSIESAEQVFDVEVFGLQGRWYLDMWRDDRVFVAEIGYQNADGSFRSLARSNEVRTPPAEPDEIVKESKHVDHNGKPLHTDWPGDQPANPQVEPPGKEMVDEAKESAPTTKPMVAEPITILDPEFPEADWPVLSPSEDEPLVETSPYEPAVDTVQAAGDASVAFDEDNVTGAESEFPSAELLHASVLENRDALQAYYDASGCAPASEGVPAEASGQSTEPPAPASSTPPPHQPAPLEQIVGLSSLEHMSKDVLLEVNAELHIFGRAKPNTELTLYGQIVKTRPDGSFSVRRPLPHGAVVLPLLYTKNT